MPPTAAPVSGEVLARSFIKEGQSNPMTPDQQKAQDLADQVRKRLDANPENPVDALKPPDRKVVKYAADQVRDRKMDLLKATPAGTRAEGVLGELDKAQKGTLVAELRRPSRAADRAILYNNIAHQILDNRPAFAGLTPREKQGVVESLLENPKTHSKIAGLLEGKLGADVVGEAELRAAQADLKQKEDALAEATAKKTQLDTEFAETAAGAGTPPTKGDRLKELSGTVGTIRTAIQAERERFNNLGKSNLAEAQRLRDLQDEIRLGGAITKAKNPGEEARMRSLLAQEDELKELEGLEAEKAGLKAEADKIPTLTKERDDAKKVEDDAKAVKEAGEQQFLQDLNELMGEAASEQLDELIDERAQTFSEELTRMEEQATTDAEKALVKGMRARWENPTRVQTAWEKMTGKPGREVSKIDKDAVKADFATLMTQGPEGLLKDMLISQLPAGLTPAQRTAELARIDKQVQDQAFVDKMTPQVAKGLVNRFVLTGGKVLPDDARIIREASWGQDVIKNALQESKDIIKDLEGLSEDDVLKSGYWDRVGKHSGLIFLLMALGGAAVFGTGLKNAFK